ncbi:MAG: GNAT family N-acetyltransferase [Thaumarchaeota archaeon]|nr:GNAT family N-acetyltransferase [Nitrososphaerota archaeon]
MSDDHHHETSRDVALTSRELSSRTWLDFEKLFEENRGVWGGCWCMFYHLTEGWSKRTALQNKSDKKQLVRVGKSHGVLVYCGDDPVGWCQFGPKEELPRIDKKKGYAAPKGNFWRITCFFVDRRHRSLGVARRALLGAIESARKAGGDGLEAYPVITGRGKKTSSSFLWSGTSGLFEEAGFTKVGPLGQASAVYRLNFR